MKKGIKDSLPVVMGYIPVAIAYGVLAKTTGVSALICFLISAMVFAGASQFIAMNLMMLNISIGEIILTTFLVNIRHFLMSASLKKKLENVRFKPIIAFGITDEFFSVASFSDQKMTTSYTLALEFIPYLTWVAFSMVGYSLGSIIPESLQLSMNIALYAMFIALIIPEIKKHYIILLVVLSAGLINTFCLYICHIPQGWSIVITVILVSFFGMKQEKVREAIHG